MKKLTRIVSVCLICVIVGCVNHVTLTPLNEISKGLGENEGILLLGRKLNLIEESNKVPPITLTIIGPTTSDHNHLTFSNREEVLVARLPAGTYKLNGFHLYDKYALAVGSFEIKPNQVTYIGHLEVGYEKAKTNWGFSAALGIQNKDKISIRVEDRFQEHSNYMYDQYPGITKGLNVVKKIILVYM